LVLQVPASSNRGEGRNLTLVLQLDCRVLIPLPKASSHLIYGMYNQFGSTLPHIISCDNVAASGGRAYSPRLFEPAAAPPRLVGA